MSPLRTLACRALTAAACLLPAAGPAAALDLLPFSGAGNLAVFDAAAGSGGWVGTITEFSDPAEPLADPLPLVSVVLFEFDTAARTLSGTFEFTTTDLAGSLVGTLSGSFVDPDVFSAGGQLSLDYQVRSATGTLANRSGYGLSFLNFDPLATGPDNYTEEGLLAVAVPEPDTVALFAAGLLLLAMTRRAARRKATSG
jgi:PEP-CTERM motif